MHRTAARVVVALALLGCGAPEAVPAQFVLPTHYVRTGVFRAPRIIESSGVAASRKHAGVIWTHNDSGDGPIVYATTTTGDDLGFVRLEGASAVDWEDIALGPCPEDVDASCIYVADTGDNTLNRSGGALYVFREPDTIPASGTLPSRLVRFRYSAGPRNVEAMAVSSDGGVWLFAKDRPDSAIAAYLIRPDDFDRDSLVLSPQIALDFAPQPNIGRVVTGAAISRDGQSLVIRTYTELFFYNWTEDGQLVRENPPCWLGLRDGQGEGVDFLADGRLVLTSEGRKGIPGAIVTVSCTTL